MRFAVLMGVLLLGGSAQASGIDGWGRLSVGGGFRWVPNWWFVDHAAQAGRPVVDHLSGGAAGNASFGLGVSQWLEVTVDLFAGYESFALALPIVCAAGPCDSTLPYGSFSGAAVLGGRLVASDWPAKGLSPWLSLQGGGILSSLTGPDLEIPERLMPTLAAGAGLNWRFSERYGVSLDARYLMGRSYVPPISGINVGGVWFTLSFVVFFPPEAKRDLAVPGF